MNNLFGDDDDDFDQKEVKHTDDAEAPDLEEIEAAAEAPTTILNAFESLVASSVLADVWFVVGQEQARIPGHRFVLSANNDVFRAMLYPLRFTDNGKAEYVPPQGEQKDIAFPDIKPARFKQLLQAIYTDKVDIASGDVKDLVPLATRFQVDALRLACSEYLEEDLTVETAVNRFEEGRALLQSASFGLQFIEENATDVFASEAWSDISREGLKIILSSDRLAADEIDVFNALNQWAAAECRRQKLSVNPDNKRQVLGDFLDLVRFTEMTMEEVVSKVSSSQLLKPEDLLALFTYLGATKDRKPKVRWNTRPRSGSSFIKKSTILEGKHLKLQKDLAKFCSHLKGKWTKIFDGQKDGMTATSFHAKCDRKGPTLVLLRSSNGNIFGGYSEQSWDGSAYKMDNSAFLFSLINSRNKPVKFRCSSPSHAIYANPSQGPSYGSGHNIYLAPSFSSGSNYCNYNGAYTLEDGSTYDNNFLAGGYNWICSAIEVYELKKSR